MKGTMLLGLMIIFISTSFILLLFTTLVKASALCISSPTNPQQISCDIKKFNVDLFFGLMIICFFFLLDVAAVYLAFS